MIFLLLQFCDLSNVRNDELAEWLRSIGISDSVIARIQDEEYTKDDLIDLVTREELIALGLK